MTKGIAFKQFLAFLIFKLRARISPGKDLGFKWIEGLRFRASKIDSGIVENAYQILQDYEESLFIMHFLSENDVFLDVGSNVGHFSLLASGVSKARSIAIEPVPDTYKKLSANVEENRLEGMITPLNIGVSFSEGQLFFSNDMYTCNRIVDEKYPNAVQVDVKSIDDVLVGEESISLMKIDIEGYELNALKGAGKLLSNQHLMAIVIELNGSGTAYGHTDEEVNDLLTKHEFHPYRYDPFKRLLKKLEKFNTNQYNTIYIREVSKVQERLNDAREIQLSSSLSL